MKFNFRTHTGPCTVNDVTARLQQAGIDASAGTEHVYGTIDAIDNLVAIDKINSAAKYNAISIAGIWLHGKW